MFRQRKFMLLVSDTEAQAMMFLGFFKEHLQDNEALINLFGLKRNDDGKVIFIKDTESDIIVQFADGHKFRIIAKGAEQKLRGLIWNGSRPDIILCHEENTPIYTPETGWILNQEHPTAHYVQAHEAYKITFDDGHTEVVSGDHRYLIEGSGWKYPWELTVGENVAENITSDMCPRTPTNANKAWMLTTIKQKLRNVLRNGIRTMLIESLLLERSGTKKIKNWCFKKLVSLLNKILNGKLLTVLNADHVSSEPFLLGFRQSN